MMIDVSQVRIYIKPGATDLRKQINGLALLVEEELAKDVLSGDLFLFCNRNRTRLKVLYWDRNGFCLWLKRLEQERFPWPMKEHEVRELTSQELGMVLDGIDFFHAHRVLEFSSTM